MTNMSWLTLLAVLLHVYSLAAADVDIDIVAQEVIEGNNFTISTKLPKLDTDPQFLFSLVNGTSEVPLAQLTCHFLKCLPDYWTSEVLLVFNEENVTLILLYITRSQTGLYKVKDLSSKQPKDKFFNVTVYGAAADETVFELSVFEGGNLTVFTATTRSEEDPQIMFSLLDGTSEDLIAQLSCYNNTCTNECSEPVFIRYDAQNVTIVLVNAKRNQTGIYKVYVHYGTRNENWMYNITVFESTRRAISPESPPSYIISKPVTAGATLCILVLALIIGVIYIYRRYHRKASIINVKCDER
ncbi:hypothetical protein E1301_Tti019835 [Triplophysa tibetana]|uniref:Uncharacterized protein n=1 Tax=Triplophysa tibetana TaxID=1572043 RepID=A0A5A9N986_9TELE|nr:hypothetical protein E1301_Tti019835 [Triplophysa tibetana]